MMTEFDDKVCEVFLREQLNHYTEPVADGIEDAREFLNDFCAHVVNSVEEVTEYFSEDYDMDTYTKEDILDMDEVFDIGDGRYLIVE